MDALRRAGIPPVDRGSLGSAFLGNGSFSAVFKVNYKGKPCVAKVTSPSEARQYTKWEEIRKSAPPEVATHMIRVLDIISLDMEVEGRGPLDRAENRWVAVVTERLVPLHRGQAAGIGGFDQQETSHRDAALWYHEGEELITTNMPDLTPKDVDLLYNWMLDGLKRNRLNRGPGNIVQFMDVHDTRSMPQEIIDMLQFRATDTERANFADDWIKRRQFNSRSKKLPEESYDDPANVDPAGLDPTVQELQKALIWFKKNNVKFSDVRRCNVMARHDGTVVISDPGLFDLPNENY